MAIVYCTTNKINGKKYIGSHNGNKSSYLGSGVNLTKAIKKYGKKNFIRQTLWEGLDNFRYEIEEYWISYFDAANNQMFYNATEKGVGAGWVKGKKRNPQQYEKRDYLKIDYSKRYIDYSKIDYKISREKAVKNTDYNLIASKIDYKVTAEKISKANKGKTAWNKGLSGVQKVKRNKLGQYVKMD